MRCLLGTSTNNCTSKCTTTNLCPDGTSTPQLVRASLHQIIDRCCRCSEITKEIKLPLPCPTGNPPWEEGTLLEAEVCGPITCREIKTDRSGGNCTTTILYKIPICIFDCMDNSCMSQPLRKNLSVIRTTTLKCTCDSVFACSGSSASSITAIVTHVDACSITITVNIVACLCAEQTVLGDFVFYACPQGAPRVCGAGGCPPDGSCPTTSANKSCCCCCCPADDC